MIIIKITIIIIATLPNPPFKIYSTDTKGTKEPCTDGKDSDNEKCKGGGHDGDGDDGDDDDEGKNTGTQHNSAVSIFAFIAFAVCFVI